MKKHIHYKSGFKYRLEEDYYDNVEICPDKLIDTDYITLNTNGDIVIKRHYQWDGPSGPTVDSKNFMRGSLVHDALYQLMREKQLDGKCRKQADKELYEDCRDDGMAWFRAKIVYHGVRRFGNFAASPKNVKVAEVAPSTIKFHGH